MVISEMEYCSIAHKVPLKESSFITAGALTLGLRHLGVVRPQTPKFRLVPLSKEDSAQPVWLGAEMLNKAQGESFSR